MLSAQEISKSFGPQRVLDRVSWQIGRGERIGLVGANGAGKTTFLRIMAGLDAPDAGSVSIPKGAVIGYLPQEVETLEGETALGQALVGFGEVRGIEEEIERIEASLAERPEPAELSRLTARYGDLRVRFEALGGYRLEGEAKAILGGLGFSGSAMHNPLATLSGGWRMRAALAGHLLRRPDLLLLDEPTNHLDLESLAWLEEFLAEYEGSLIIVSHDRFFLNRVANEIAELERGRLTLYTGDYDDYIEEKEAREEALLAAKKNQDRQIAATQRFIDRFRYKATKARQVQSRIKQLGKIERIQVRRAVKGIRFDLPQPARSGAETIRIDGVRKSFGEKLVYENAHFVARRADRIALVGPNGAGKTTLLKILAGVLPFEAGTRSLGHNVTLHYYAQHQLEALGSGRTVLEEIETVAPDDLRPRLRSLLGAFLFTGEDVDKKVGVLSGGEKARLALAKMLVRPASLLLLDEPTNHLDLRSRDVLESALDAYSGTMVLISHDRYFINRIATSICEVRDGRLDLRPGSYDDYLERTRGTPSPSAQAAANPTVRAAAHTTKVVAANTTKQDAANPAAPAAAAAQGPEGTTEGGAPGSGPKSREQKRAEALERQRRYQEMKGPLERLSVLEKEIAGLEERLRTFEAALADPATYRDGDRARELSREHKETQERIAWLYDEWAALEEGLSRG